MIKQFHFTSKQEVNIEKYFTPIQNINKDNDHLHIDKDNEEVINTKWNRISSVKRHQRI